MVASGYNLHKHQAGPEVNPLDSFYCYERVPILHQYHLAMYIYHKSTNLLLSEMQSLCCQFLKNKLSVDLNWQQW